MWAVSRRNARATIALGAVLAAAVFVPSFKASDAAADPPGCFSGAHSLSSFGARVYPEMGNGGYTSLHSDVFLNYDAIANLFLPGTHADLQVRSTQCLSDLSFDFEQTNGHTADGTGPNMSVNSVLVNGVPASFTFKQPTYPGDPNGQDDPDPLAHAVSNVNPVSATNPNPPACSPQVNNATQNGTQCPANKLVITPSTPIPDGTTVTVTINYTGRPGVHTDGDGSTEGWFRIATAGSEGSFVTTEPVGNDSWMPMNNYPSAKPTYDIYDTTNIGKVAIGPGELVGYTAPVGTTYQPVPAPPSNAPDANFPLGSVTWHWHSPEPIASYLVENSIGAYDLSARTSPTSGVQYWEAQASTITATRKATNKIAMDNQEDIVNFQQTFNGPWPLTTDGVVVGTPSASFEEEMQGKITFAGGQIGGATGTSLGTFNHENMHQWFGDNVAEAAFNLTWWKEGFATLGEYLCTARNTPSACGAPGVPASDDAFEQTLISRFNGTGNYNTASSTFWTQAPNNPSVNSLFTTAFTYTRPGTAYVALWRTLGRARMISAMKDIQATYGGGSITQPQLEAAFRKWLPTPSASCNARLTQFYAQWWNTSYPSGGANTLNRPMLTGPGLNGQGFPCAKVTPAEPNGQNGWYTTDVDVDWSGFPTPAATITAARTGCGDASGHESITTDGTFTPSCEVSSTVTATGANAGTSGPISEAIKRDATAPTTTASVAPPSPDLLNGWYGSAPTVTLTPDDGTSGLASTKYTVDGGAPRTYSVPFAVTTEGSHTIQYWSTDNAGNQESPQSLTVKLDLNAPVTTATLTPGIRNGWYASPTLTLTGDDGAGSGIDHISYSLDGAAFQTYSGPLSGFTTGNHFVQYRSTDNGGRVEAVKLIAFKVDADPPTVNIARPKAGAEFKLGQVVKANYKCADDKNKGSGLDTCVGTVANGHAIDTLSVGDHTFTVTATDKAGNVTTVVHSYHVRGTAVRSIRFVHIH
jgi:hypothetical protein